MKKVINIAAIIGLLVITAGCVGPMYTTEQKATNGKGWGLFSSGAAAQARVDRMAVNKLQATPVQIGIMGPNGPVPAVSTTTNAAPAGYLGVIANMSAYRRLTFKYFGPESGIEYLSSGQQVEKYLLPGVYSGEIFFGGQKVGWATFRSEPVEKSFLGKKVHWFFYSEW